MGVKSRPKELTLLDYDRKNRKIHDTKSARKNSRKIARNFTTEDDYSTLDYTTRDLYLG